jgi:flagellar biosynthetic protein FlhB
VADGTGEKSFEPTPSRRERARQEGHVARSHDLVSAALLAGALVTLTYFGGSVAEYLFRLARRQLGGQAWLAANHEFAVEQWHLVTRELGLVLLPFFTVIVFVALGANVLQVGFRLAPHRLLPDVGRLNPMEGAQRLFSAGNGVRMLMGILKLLVVAAAVWWSLRSDYQQILGLSNLEVPQIVAYFASLSGRTMLWATAALVLLSLLDYGYQRWNHERGLRMTPQELREEQKSQQGDPQLTTRRRARQRQLLVDRLARATSGTGEE